MGDVCEGKCQYAEDVGAPEGTRCSDDIGCMRRDLDMLDDLWAVHIEGPDDIIPAKNREDAEATARHLNEWYDKEPKTEFSPHINAVVVPWIGSAAHHAEILRREHTDETGERA
jgi:hypothetical protein